MYVERHEKEVRLAHVRMVSNQFAIRLLVSPYAPQHGHAAASGLGQIRSARRRADFTDAVWLRWVVGWLGGEAVMTLHMCEEVHHKG
ncbi:hypothetical protein MRB53_041536 [Persea americana]|nr:hypothetical protein MRB53_041536 [Persea americana]